MSRSDPTFVRPVAERPLGARDSGKPMPWIEVKSGSPYFLTELGQTWTPIGQNDAVSWPELAGLFRRRDLPGVERHLKWLKDSGVTCLRLMLEYCQGEHRYFERPAGTFNQAMVSLWDDLFALLERVGLYVLLTPFDTFFTWIRWRHHPYNRANGGPCSSRKRLLTCAQTRAAIKRRLAFATDRWGHSPALFAWDLWNEMHPAHGGDDPGAFEPFITDVSTWLRQYEISRHGRAHLQTVSIFGPELIAHPSLCDPIFRHPGLDFANTHLYEYGTIDDPADTVAPAAAVGRLMRSAVNEARDLRPVFDSEHGPIHRFKDKKHTLSEPFDDEYFRHMQWAHVASGGAGGGMRWPNRHPHVLTTGMRHAQAALAAFLPLIDWRQLRRRNLNEELRLDDGTHLAFGCGDERQAIVWLLRRDSLTDSGMVDRGAPCVGRVVAVPGLADGNYQVLTFDTVAGQVTGTELARSEGGWLKIATSAGADLALAIIPADACPN